MRVLYPLMVSAGVVQMVIPSTLHNIMQHFHLSAGQGGLLPLIYFAGIMLGNIFLTRLLQKLSVKAIIICGSLLVFVSLGAASVCQWYPLFVFFLLLAGFGNASVAVLPGLYATSVLREESAHILPTLFGFLSLGYILGPLFPGFIEHLQISWQWALVFPGVLTLLFAIPVGITRLKPIGKVEVLSLKFVREMISFDRRFFIGLVVALILAGGAVRGLLIWLVTFLDGTRGMGAGSAHIVLCGVGVGMLLGRLACGYAVKKWFSTYRMLIIITITSAVLISLAPLTHAATVNAALFLGASLFFAGITPLLLTASAVYPRAASSSAYSILFIMTSVGGLIIPCAMGHAFELVGAVTAMSLIGVLFLGALVFLLLFRKELPIAKHAHYDAFPY